MTATNLADYADHLIFERWRNLPLENYADSGSPRHAEYLADVRLSYEGYAAAFRRGLERMGYATETEAAASWNSLVARASSVTMENFSMNSTGEGTPPFRQTPSLPRRAPGGDTYASPESSSSTTNTSGAFMVEDSTDSDGKRPQSLAKATAPTDKPDLFGFNESSASTPCWPSNSPCLLRCQAHRAPDETKSRRH